MAKKITPLKRRTTRVRKALAARGNLRPRLSVFRSSKQIYAQVIDDAKGVTVASASTLEKDLKSGKKTGADMAAAKAISVTGTDDSSGKGLRLPTIEQDASPSPVQPVETEQAESPPKN